MPIIPTPISTMSRRRWNRRDGDVPTATYTARSVATRLRSGSSPIQDDEHGEQSSNKGNSLGNDSSDTASLLANVNRRWILGVAVTALTAASVAAKLGLLPGPVDAADGAAVGGVYTDTMILQDLGATVLTAILGYLFVTLNTYAVSKEWVEPRDSRKIIHTLSAPLFMLFWPLFSPAVGARYFAAIVPTINAIRLYMAGSGNTQETSLARAVSRSGDKSEALGGPFVYVVIMAVTILVLWRDSAAGIVALSALAAGDGMADLIGRRYGKSNPWPGLDKSVAGTVAFWMASTLTGTGLLLWMQHWTGSTTLIASSLSATDLLARVGIICLVSALLELVPFGDDNYTVPISAALLSILLLHT